MGPGEAGCRPRFRFFGGGGGESEEDSESILAGGLMYPRPYFPEVGIY